MRLLELVFILIVFGFLIAQSVRIAERKYLIVLLSAGLSTVVLSVLLGQVRWQLAPAYLLFGILSLLVIRHAYSHAIIRSIGVLFGILLLAISVTLSLGLPILALPAPSGPYVVGSASFSLTDESRNNAFFDAPHEKRELSTHVWYPGVVPEDQPEPRVQALWEELYRGERDHLTVFTSYLRGVRTHSYEDIPLSPAQTSYPVLIFSHAMVSFAEQNTLLMEHLASHGYVVFAVGHSYTSLRAVFPNGSVVYPDLDRINEASAQRRTVDNDVALRVEQAASPEERADLQVESYERARELNEIMAIWVDDLRFVLDAITAPPNTYSELRAFWNRLDVDRIGMLGMSFGGGAVTELCKADGRCRAALNLDGDTFGQRQRQALEIPYLALIRDGQNSLDYLLPASRSDYYEIAVEDTTHLDFTDDTLVLPILKWLHVTGSIAGERIIDVTNMVSLRFFDAYLLEGPKPRFDGDFPELTVEMNDYARE